LRALRAAPTLVFADNLQRRNIPEEALAWPGGDPGQAPRELVAILGAGRFRITDEACTAAYSPNGKLLAGGEDLFTLISATIRKIVLRSAPVAVGDC
jgi:hypothetical protein